MAENRNTTLKLTGLALLAFVLFNSSKTGSEVLTKHGAINNPGNIRTEAKKYPGEIESPNPDFKSFSSLAYGYAAMIIKLRSYFASGYTTLWEIINHWSPESDNNDPEAYVGYILDHLGPDLINDADEQVAIYNDDVMLGLISLMSDVEQRAGFSSDAAVWNSAVAAFNYA